MKYQIKIYEYGLDNMYVKDIKDIPITTNDKKLIFSRRHMYRTIIEAQKDSLEYIDTEVVNGEYLKTIDGNVGWTLTEMPDLRILGKDVYCAPMLKISIAPDEEKEYDTIIDFILNERFINAKCRSGVVQLPNIKGFKEYWDAIAVGTKYITAHAFDEYTGVTRSHYNEHYWVINKNDLYTRNKIIIDCPDLLVPHVIGKGGKNITKLKCKLVEDGIVKDPDCIPSIQVRSYID